MGRILKLKGVQKHLRNSVLELRASSTFTIFYNHRVDQNGLEHMISTTKVDGKEAHSQSRTYDWQLREAGRRKGLV
jgi:hypothetical protein